MNGIYRTIAGRIRVDLQELARVVERTGRIWQQALAATDDYYVDATALNLHGFYAGLERLLEIIADGVDQAKPAGAHWHDDLLRQMAAEVPGVRPPVLSQETPRAPGSLSRLPPRGAQRLHLQLGPGTDRRVGQTIGSDDGARLAGSGRVCRFPGADGLEAVSTAAHADARSSGSMPQSARSRTARSAAKPGVIRAGSPSMLGLRSSQARSGSSLGIHTPSDPPQP